MSILEGGLWANIHAKRERIKNGSGERMRKPGEKGAPTAADFKAANEEVEIDEGWKEKVAAVALAGSVATGAGAGANTPKVPLDKAIHQATAVYNINKAVKKHKEKEAEKRKPGEKGAPTAADFKAARNEELDIQTSDDYKTTKSGKKVKAHKIVFNKGEDDRKGVTEQMKKSYKDFVEQHTPDLTEEQKNELVAELQEVLGKDDPAGKWISDFVHSDNPKFAGKSKEKRKQMALAAYYANQRKEETEVQEELKGNQHKLDKNKNGKLDKQDFKMLRKEEQDIEEGLKPEHKMRPGWMLKADPVLAKKVKEKQDLAKKRQQSYGDPKAGISVKEEKMEESVFDWKNKPRQTSDKSTTATKHDVKKTSTGTVYTKQRDADGMSKEFNRSGEAAQKRGRGRPKKSSFGEAVEFLMSLDEEMFDSMMEEGFDAFMEQYEQLDEVSKATLGSYVKKAVSGMNGVAVNAHMAGNADSRTAIGKQHLEKARKRIAGIEKATDRLTK